MLKIRTVILAASIGALGAVVHAGTVQPAAGTVDTACVVPEASAPAATADGASAATATPKPTLTINGVDAAAAPSAQCPRPTRATGAVKATKTRSNI